MTSIRKSTVFSKEDELGKGKGSGYEWMPLPPGYKFSHTPSRSTTRIQSPGTKRFDNIAYGMFSGTWEMQFMLDWNYLEPLQMVYEAYMPEKISEGKYRHSFRKSDVGRVESYVFREAYNNKMAGGLEDEVIEIRGCVAKSITFSKAAGTSQTQVTISGFYVFSKNLIGSIEKTDYSGYKNVNLAEYMCLFIGELKDENYVANTESLTISIDNSAESVYNTCSPFAGQYEEGISSYAFSTVALANDPRHYRLRLNSGGKDNTHYQPMSKGLAPIDEMHMISYSEEAVNHDDSRVRAFEGSDNRLNIIVDRCVIKSVPYQSGDGSKLEDSISSAECGEIYMEFITSRPTYRLTKDNDHKLSSVVIPTSTSTPTPTPVDSESETEGETETP